MGTETKKTSVSEERKKRNEEDTRQKYKEAHLANLRTGERVRVGVRVEIKEQNGTNPPKVKKGRGEGGQQETDPTHTLPSRPHRTVL